MSRSRPASGRLVPVLVATVAAALALPGTAGAAQAATESRTYIVQLEARPLASYTGGKQGLPATSPRATGEELAPRSRAAVRYRAYLRGEEQRALARLAAGPRVLHRYRAAFAGFAAALTEAQAATLAAAPEVARVWPDELLHVTAGDPGGGPLPVLGSEGPNLLGLPGGLWRQLGGPEHAGEGVVVGVIDTGIHPEHPSFADEPLVGGAEVFQGPAYDPPPYWAGVCQGGEAFATTACNDKLIGARWFVAGFGVERIAAGEFLSPRDANGHGTHTASTAAGNFGVDPAIGGADLGVDRISGIAPRAWVAAYKVCWNGREDPEQIAGGCATSDSVAAIDAAVFDGVDVINFSVGGASSTLYDPISLSFLGASDAGVFVANSAGNSGPDAQTVGNPTGAPWLTSVGASTLARTFAATATVRDAAAASPAVVTVTGASVTPALPEAPIVDAAAVPAADATPAAAELCQDGTLDPAAVAGRVVLCKRGTNARVAKSKAVRDAGGVGMILYNLTDSQDLVTDSHWLPTVHVTNTDGLAVKALVAAASQPVATLSAGALSPARPDALAAFSSRGPQRAVPDIPKPDLVAPGVNILAGMTPTPSDPEAPAPAGELFQAISGTSMAAPHVAGAAALLTQLHPTWSPSALKSALMTTADPEVLREDGQTRATPHDAGSGRIVPNRAAAPGLVLEETTLRYLGYLEGQRPGIVRQLYGITVPAVRAPDLNLPAVAVNALAAAVTTTRTFTSVDRGRATWRVTTEGLGGVRTTVTPSIFRIAPGQRQTVTLTLTPRSAPFDRYAYGSVVLTNRQDGRTLRLPVSVQPVRLDLPEQIDIATTAASGSQPLGRVGAAGTQSALGWGLAAADTTPGLTIPTAPEVRPTPVPGPGVNVKDVTVAPGSQLLVGETANVDGGQPGTDLDLLLYHDGHRGAPDGQFTADELVTREAGSGALETIAVAFPTPGAYRFVTVGFRTRNPSTYDFSTWIVADPTPDDPANPPAIVVTGDPATPERGGIADLVLSWSGVTADGVYWGLVTYHEGRPETVPPADPATMTDYSLVRLVKTTAP